MEWGDCVYALEGDLDADKLGADWMQLRRESFREKIQEEVEGWQEVEGVFEIIATRRSGGR